VGASFPATTKRPSLPCRRKRRSRKRKECLRDRIELVRKSTKFLDRRFVTLESCPAAGCLDRMVAWRCECPSTPSLQAIVDAAYVVPHNLSAGSALQVRTKRRSAGRSLLDRSQALPPALLARRTAQDVFHAATTALCRLLPGCCRVLFVWASIRDHNRDHDNTRSCFVAILASSTTAVYKRDLGLPSVRHCPPFFANKRCSLQWQNCLSGIKHVLHPVPVVRADAVIAFSNPNEGRRRRPLMSYCRECQSRSEFPFAMDRKSTVVAEDSVGGIKPSPSCDSRMLL